MLTTVLRNSCKNKKILKVNRSPVSPVVPADGSLVNPASPVSRTPGGLVSPVSLAVPVMTAPAVTMVVSLVILVNPASLVNQVNPASLPSLLSRL